jgi:DNA-binding XRE family transcriptional regulator
MAKKRRSTPRITTWEGLAEAVIQWRQDNAKTQTELGSEIGVSQSLIVLVEKAEPVSQLNVRRIAEKLQVDATALERSDRPSPKAPLAYCGSTRCPSLSLAANEGELFIAPKFYVAAKLTSEVCPFCDLPMHHHCPNCSKPIHERRLVCEFCHQRFVEVPVCLRGNEDQDVQQLADEWDARNRRIREHLSLK